MTATEIDHASFDRATDTLMDSFTKEQAEALLALRGDPALQARIDELASRNTEGLLTAEELAEYKGYVRANNFIAVLQAKARRFLSRLNGNGRQDS